MRRSYQIAFIMLLAMTAHSAHAQDWGMFQPGDPVDFVWPDGVWHDWQSGQNYFDDPYDYYQGGLHSDEGWGYASPWDDMYNSDYVAQPFDASNVWVLDFTQTQSCFAGFRPAYYVRSDGAVMDSWCEPVPTGPGDPGVGATDAWHQEISLFFDWGLGLGPDSLSYKTGSLQVAQMQGAPGIEQARIAWYNKNSAAIANRQCFALQNLTDYDVKFGLQGAVDAGGNATRQFVGSYSVDITQNPDGSTHFTIYNVTSMTSFLDGTVGDWERSHFSPGGNMSQTYEWDEWLCANQS